MVVFDGLDEVPQDAKDKVGSEVAVFVTQVAVEQDCDLLSVCTSRPQGYSGQFQELDGASIELLPLPIERAFKCARPVVSFQRSSPDSRRSIELLEASASSSALRELLTTPLQSHIVAILVRDGERPPDRRWKLYDRFYDVIRRREANRNLPDAELARLLREDLKLLKTLHNRLGLALHADAETSKGAETSLEPAAFRELAHRTVSEMIEKGIEQKVEVLARATTERLVLINTPVSGSALRFDIRQLQEFFAGECLYDSVTAEELRQRVATIGGDAHWREVTHFLLSALIENNRSTELSVAIEELVRLNEGDMPGASRAFKRREGKGALLAARLLSEGVLEEDKSVRQRFENCLKPMAGFASINRLTSLLDVRQVNSRGWLLTFLIETLREAAWTESIGAAIVLAHALPDDHQRVDEVVQILLKASPRYLSAIVHSLGNSPNWDEGLQQRDWIVSLLAQLLIRPTWSELGADAINGALLIIARTWRQHSAVLHQLVPRHASLFHWVASSSALPLLSRRFSMSALGYATPDFSDLVDRSEYAVNQDTGDEAPGILGFARLSRFASDPSRRLYLEILTTLSATGESLMSRLQQAFRFPLPTIPSGGSIAEAAKEIDAMSNDEFTALLASGKLRPAQEVQPLKPSYQIDEVSPAMMLELHRHSPVLATRGAVRPFRCHGGRCWHSRSAG